MKLINGDSSTPPRQCNTFTGFIIYNCRDCGRNDRYIIIGGRRIQSLAVRNELLRRRNGIFILMRRGKPVFLIWTLVRRTSPKKLPVIPTGVPACKIYQENELEPGQSGGIFFVIATNFTF